ncbi:MAG: AAA family ATPase [Pseudomonadota bacterium]
MSNFTFRPAIRINTPMILGLAGPSKSGKTYSALRLAMGMADGGDIAMINTEGPRGHQYADTFKYLACDLTEPFSMKRYEEAIKDAAAIKPAVLIIDSVSHAHEGSGGMLDQHEKELDKMAGPDYAKRERMTWAAWVKPKADEAGMINTMLQVGCHIILCFRAKEKIKIVRGQPPLDLGWRPIGSDRIHFETAVTLILPPNSKGIPDMSATGSELREPFDSMIKPVQIDEALGKSLAEWAKGGVKKQEPILPDLDTMKHEMADWFEATYHEQAAEKFKEMMKGATDNPLKMQSEKNIRWGYEEYKKLRNE